MPVHLTATMGRSGSQVESLSAPGRGFIPTGDFIAAAFTDAGASATVVASTDAVTLAVALSDMAMLDAATPDGATLGAASWDTGRRVDSTVVVEASMAEAVEVSTVAAGMVAVTGKSELL